MIDLFKIRQAIGDLREMGIHVDSMHCTPETLAEIQGVGLDVISVVKGNGPPPQLKEFPVTLCGVPLRQVQA